MIEKILKCLILIGLFNCNTYSQELVPPIQNYSPTQYSAASQNWDIALDKRGVVYTANNQGLLVFDGLSWELFPLESQSIIRSVYPYNDRIYTGSYQEFGYWERNDMGQMGYISLSAHMRDIDLQSESFWEIVGVGNSIFFRSFGGIYEYKDDSIHKIQEAVSAAIDIFQDKLVILQRQKGISYLNTAGNLIPLVENSKKLQKEELIDIEVQGDTLYIGSRNKLFVYHDKKLRSFPSKDLNRLLAESELNKIISISPDEIVLGTIKNGVINYNIVTGEVQVFNRTSGLQNNTVLGMAYKKGRLWLALDKGVDMIDLKAPITFYTDNTGELGAVYDLQIFNNSYYLASNTGVYTFSNDNLRLIENAGDHAWNLEIIDNSLYANHNTGIYEIDENSFIPIDTRTGSFSIKKVDENSGRLLVSHYTGLSLYDKGKAEIKELEGINFPVKEVVFEDSNTLWAAHPYEGIYKVEHDNFEDLNIKKIRALGDKKNFSPKIYKINNQIISYVNRHWYKYNPFKDDFEPFEELRGFNDTGLIYIGSEYYAFVNSEKGELLITDLKGERLILGPDQLKYRLVKSNENLIRENDSIFFISLNDGFVRVNLNQLRNESKDQWISEPYIKEFSDDIQRYSLSKSPVIPYQNSKNITLKAGMPVSRATKLDYILDGEETLSGTVKSGMLNFRNLEHGDYKLQLKAVGNELDEVPTQNFRFSIAPPWYLSLSMKVVYFFLFISIIVLIYLLNQQKLKKHQLQLEAKFEKEHAERLNRLEKERLIDEIDLKRKELANTTMMAAKKNEVLMEIQGELSKDKNKFSNQFRLKHIMNKINNAVKNKDEWKVFETNFNEVHEDFFKDVLDKYPKLTSKDLKLCSYLKMNLSSKEIAPLMGISVRGVEVHRYRLRKKMNLDSDVNLTKFLIKNF